MATVWNQCDANFCPKFKQERLHDNVYLVLPTQHNKRNIYVSITEVFDGENGWTNVRFLCVKGWRVRPTKFCRWIILHHQYVLLMGLPCNIFILIKQFSRSLSTIEDYNSLTVSETDDAFRNFPCYWGSNFLGSCIDLQISLTDPLRALWLAPGRRVVNIKVFMCHSSQFLITFMYGVLGKLRKLKIFLVTICGTKFLINSFSFYFLLLSLYTELVKQLFQSTSNAFYADMRK